MQNLPLVNFRLTLKGRNLRMPSHIEAKKERKTEDMSSEGTTRVFTPICIEAR